MALVLSMQSSVASIDQNGLMTVWEQYKNDIAIGGNQDIEMDLFGNGPYAPRGQVTARLIDKDGNTYGETHVAAKNIGSFVSWHLHGDGSTFPATTQNIDPGTGNPTSAFTGNVVLGTDKFSQGAIEFEVSGSCGDKSIVERLLGPGQSTCHQALFSGNGNTTVRIAFSISEQ